ncbi:MAG: hypothetical protein PVF15_09415 [Candidatus Bathyarchaeota archaeon]|jgi:Ca2+/Na+ antiporter
MDKGSQIEVFFGLLGMFSVWVSMIFGKATFLTWIGIWIVFITLSWHYYRIRKEAEKQGKDVLI